MICNNCGTENENGAVFCYNCGISFANNNQPQNVPETQSQYGYEQSQYGYAQPQYGYEQPQYVYEQPQNTYEQPAAPKKNKNGAVIAVLVVALLLVILGFVGYIGYQQGWFDKKEEAPTVVEEPTGPVIQSTNNSNKDIKGEIIIVNRRKHGKVPGGMKPFANKEKGYKGPLEDDPDSQYYFVLYYIKNTSDSNIDLNNLFIEGKLDDTIDLDWKVYCESDDGKEFLDDSIIEPGDCTTVYFVATVPNSDAESYKRVTLRFGYDLKFSPKAALNGEKACDYIFEFSALRGV